jgi:hypothetical protein
MRLLWSSWRPGHLRQSIFHVELAYVKNTVSSLVLVRSSSTCGHSTLDSSIVIHLHCWEKGSRLRSNLLLYNLMVVPLPVGWLSFSRLWTGWKDILSFAICFNLILIWKWGTIMTSMSILICANVIPSSSERHWGLYNYLGLLSPITFNLFIDLSGQFFKFLCQLFRLSFGSFKLVRYNLVIFDISDLVLNIKRFWLLLFLS